MGQGREVTLQRSSFTIPPRCASCGAPQQTTLDAKKKKGLWGGGSVTRTFHIPYCTACADRARSTRMKGWIFAGATFAVALVLSAIGLVLPKLPAVLLVALPTVVAFGIAIVAMTALAPPAPPLPATAPGDAVRLISFKDERSTLYCTNPQWADEFAQMNGVTATQKSRSSFFGIRALWAALLAPVAATIVWFIAHPQIHIDNATADSMQIWLDGKPVTEVKSNINGVVPPSIWVPHGEHKIGYSKMGAAAPEGVSDVVVTMNDAHLYNPGKSACYWLVADSYGAASVDGIAQGPQPIKEYYSFDKVNTWFGDNPQSVEVQNGQSGDTRVALQRAKGCMELVKHGCSVETREKFIACQRSAKGDAQFEGCFTSAKEECSGAPSAAAHTATPAASVHPAAHTLPHPGPHPSAHTPSAAATTKK